MGNPVTDEQILPKSPETVNLNLRLNGTKAEIFSKFSKKEPIRAAADVSGSLRNEVDFHVIEVEFRVHGSEGRKNESVQ